MKKKKNILIIMADQLGASFINCYGSGVDSTPTIDSLASKGMLFERCYATSPVCAPNRASMLTGRSPIVHGITRNNYVLSNDLPTFAHVLRDSGYTTAHFGKLHQTPMSLDVPRDLSYLGFDYFVVTEDMKWGPYLEWVQDNYPEHYEHVLSYCWWYGLRNLSDDEKEQYKNVNSDILGKLKETTEWNQMYSSTLPAKLHDTTYITNCTIDFLDKQHSEDKPFVCQVSFVDPHDPYDPPAPYDKMFSPDDMPEPIPKDWDDDSFLSTRVFLGYEKITDNAGANKKLRALYHGSIRFIDDQIKRIVNKLSELNILDDTIIVFTTDHGDALGDHGLITKGVVHYDASIRVPLIVYGSDIAVGKTNRLTCTLDFFPTFCDIAEITEMRPPNEGNSFYNELCGKQGEYIDAVSVAVADAFSVVTDDGFRLTMFPTHNEGQMFDLVNDPKEQKNLYYDSNYADKKIELLEKLAIVTQKPTRIPQYRNMPVYNGYKVKMEDPNSSDCEIVSKIYNIGKSEYL